MNKKLICGIIADIVIIITAGSCLFFYVHREHIQIHEIEKINNRLEKIERQLNIKGE